MLFVQVETVLKFGHVKLPRERNIDTSCQPAKQTLSLVPRRAAALAVGECRPVYASLHPCPRTHVEIRGQNGPGRRALEPHTIPINMCAATTAVCCCYCCCCCAADGVNVVWAVPATAAMLMLMLVD